ncbi:MAG: hypothetical protein ABIF40_00755 [archaeon]
MFFGKSKPKIKKYVRGYKEILKYLHENMMHKDVTVYVGYGCNDNVESQFSGQLGLAYSEIDNNGQGELELVFFFDPQNLEMRLTVDNLGLMVPEDNENSCYISSYYLDERMQIYLEQKS